MSEDMDPAVPTPPDAQLEFRRRKAEAVKGTIERREFAATGLECRSLDDGTLRLTGYASVTENAYEVGSFTETIKRGAFKRTLAEGPDTVLLINHEGLPLARTKAGTLVLAEDARGLRIDADLDPEDPDSQSLVRKMRRGDIDQMSMAFIATDQEWTDDFTQRAIRSVSLHRGDVSVVTMAANEAATASVRSAQGAALDGVIAVLEHRAGKMLSASTTETLSQVLKLVAQADEAVDEAQPLLADLMDVPNPDEPDDESDAAPDPRALPPDFTPRARQRLSLLEGRGQ